MFPHPTSHLESNKLMSSGLTSSQRNKLAQCNYHSRWNSSVKANISQTNCWSGGCPLSDEYLREAAEIFFLKLISNNKRNFVCWLDALRRNFEPKRCLSSHRRCRGPQLWINKSVQARLSHQFSFALLSPRCIAITVGNRRNVFLIDYCLAFAREMIVIDSRLLDLRVDTWGEKVTKSELKSLSEEALGIRYGGAQLNGRRQRMIQKREIQFFCWTPLPPTKPQQFERTRRRKRAWTWANLTLQQNKCKFSNSISFDGSMDRAEWDILSGLCTLIISSFALP